MSATALALADVTDLSTFPPRSTFDLTFKKIRGPRVVLEWITRLWLSETGTLSWAPSRGFDVLGLENGSFSMTDLYNVRARLIQEARSVMYVRSVDLTLRLQAGTLSVTAAVTLVDGQTYPLAVSIGPAAQALHDATPLGPLVAVDFGRLAA
jgi:hypothetical protein